MRHSFPSAVPKRARGFTLIELLVSVTILAVLAAIAVPAMNEFVTNQRTTRSANQLLSDLALARTQALILQRPVRVSAVGGSWADGWEVSSDADYSGTLNPGAGIINDEQIRQTEALPDEFGLSLVDNSGTGLVHVWFDRLGAGAAELPGGVIIDYPVRFVVDRPDLDPDRAATLCVASSGAAFVRKGTAAC